MSKWRVIGANAATGANVVETIEAKNGRLAEDAARDRGILISSVEPLHSASVGPQHGPASIFSPADWRKLESTIIKGVCGGALLLFVLQAIAVLAYMIFLRTQQP